MKSVQVVVAPDSFKGTASAIEVAGAIAAGWASVRELDELRLMPMADGGEGTLEAFEVAVPGARRMPVIVTGPDDRAVDAYWLLLPGGTGVVELANSSGLTLLDPLRPLTAHTHGFGQAIAAALDHGVDRLLLALGGSSSTDAGLGALTALGARATDAAGRAVMPGGLGLSTVAAVELGGLRPLPPGGARILCDVTSPLLGPAGAAAVFAPQKGASLEQVAALESGLARFAGFVAVEPQTPGAGAAGGTGFGLLAWGATMAPGAAAVGQALGVPGAVAGAAVVITGEGRFDAQSDAGKVPSYLAGLAADAGARAYLVAGLIEAGTERFAGAESLTELAGGGAAAMNDPLRWITLAARRLAAAQPA
ncbi:glycerate kinase [Cryobacterium melibiosiphilum]|uniref:Glycerate kinase n=1 Tax=Cryobacterium melibiosiphilum TaxID=995039 RepID=A0A3A5M8M6_9MICO|nr:glycerate kinase [Cryobacterium melibiosiphilum]RJT85323.1 glycerate kinase [Cryobacterium melibiosiphilum]